MLDQLSRAPDGWLEMAMHAGQRAALDSKKRWVTVYAGWQSGKTVIGPPWLLNEIKDRGPGDYLGASPTYPLMQVKMLPEFRRLFQTKLRLGTFVGQPRPCFTLSESGARRLFGGVPDVPTQVFFGHASTPDSLESATLKAAWLDECGQSIFPLASWETIQGRLSLNQGRCLLTSRPYNLGWFVQLFWTRWLAAGKNHPLIDVINFRSIDNPSFNRAEFDRNAEEMPPWKFQMYYLGIPTQPAGLIYGSFSPVKHVVPTFRIPQHWPRHVGIDFGPVNTAAVFVAEELDGLNAPTGRLFAYREYHPAVKRDPKDHVAALTDNEPCLPHCVGGSPQEDEWRERFGAVGLPVVEPPIGDVEVGIDLVYGVFARGELIVMEHLTGLRDELATYSRELDDGGEPTEKIENKSAFHLLDALRYLLTDLKRDSLPAYGRPTRDNRSAMSKAQDAGVFPELPEGMPEW